MNLTKKLIEFAEKDEDIIALTKGNSPEDDATKTTVYYFMVRGSYNAERSDKISQLDIDLAQERYTCRLNKWPNVIISDYPFLGEVIWKKE